MYYLFMYISIVCWISAIGLILLLIKEGNFDLW